MAISLFLLMFKSAQPFTIVNRRTILEKAGAKLRRFSRAETQDIFGVIGETKFYIRKGSDPVKEITPENGIKFENDRGGVDCWMFKPNEPPWCVYCGVSFNLNVFLTFLDWWL